MQLLSNSDPATGVVPVQQPNTESKRGFARRLADSLSDPVLRILVIATLIGRVGRGVFATITVLFITFVLGLTVGEAAIVLGISSAVGIGASYLGGRLADSLSARRMLFWLMAAEGLALACYPFAGGFTSVLIIACIASMLSSASNATRMAIIARAFEGPARVSTRAILRTVTNVSMAAGAALAGIALLVNTPTAYRVVLIGAGAVYVIGAIPVWRLPQRVDAPKRTAATHDSSQPAVSQSAAPRLGRSPFRDPRYLVLTALAAVFGMQFGLAEVGVPLWIVSHTTAPTVLVSILLIVNTVIVIIFQIPLSRGTHDLRKAGKVVTIAGVLMALACVAYALSAGVSMVPAIALLVVAAIVHAFAEVWSQAGTWGLSFELADEANAGAYQGVFSMGFGVGAMAAPFVVAGTALAFGMPGWIALAAIFLAAALGISAIARRAAAPVAATALAAAAAPRGN
ncbi:MFS transporter [Leifsonia sp. A12D58]|uniref:MFS transporter n=1 Tax=Leifsonia sp. A12D58 TaxID=3397674 RepID=UPI0039E17FFF